MIESERETFTIKHGLNGTPVTTKVDTNPQKVLEHTNLKGNTDYVKVTHSEGSETTTIDSSKTSTKFNELDKTIANKQDKLTPGYGISIENNVVKAPLFTRVVAGTDLNTIEYGFVRGDELLNAPDNGWYYIQSCSEGRNSMQIAWKLQLSTNQPKLEYRRDRVSGNWTEWVQTYPHNIEEVEVDNDLYSGYYLKNGNHLLQFKAAAKEGQYIDLSNFSFPTGVNPHHAYTLDVIFEHPSTSGATSASEAIALFTVGDDNKITINTQVVTSSLLVSNLTKVKAITLL